MVVRCPVRHLGIVCRDRSCMLEQWATIQRCPIGVSASGVTTQVRICGNDSVGIDRVVG
jgi:hypothetical protein